jgi:hypothetical protein
MGDQILIFLCGRVQILQRVSRLTTLLDKAPRVNFNLNGDRVPLFSPLSSAHTIE